VSASAAAVGAVPTLLAGVGRPPTRAEHLRLHGPLPPARGLTRLLAESGLQGRGGGGFPTARKLAAVAAGGGRPVVVANGAEGEPLSKKDRALLRVAPHLVLDGAALLAQELGSSEVVVGVTQPAPELEAAIRERSPREDRVRFDVQQVPSGFVSGEETALVRALGGGPPKPTTKPPYPFERGLRGRPTLVQNVETLAHAALIARHGPAAGRTTLVTLSGAVARPGVHEAPVGVTLADLLASCGGVTSEVAAVLVGGYFGSFVAAEAARSLTVAPGTVGAGTIVVVPASTCAASECARVVRYLACESAGQCGPCSHGLPALAAAVERADAGETRRLASLVDRRGACRHPDGAARLARSALDVFAGEFARHAARRGCGRRDEGVLPA
jgi:NADH:ubiquinone oxidoreductase subunit F (NADH-binding)